MTEEYKKVYMEVLDILDVNLGIEGDIITNRFATATKLIEHLSKGNSTLVSVINWVAFDFMKLETRPPKYDKYLICRKDGKIHWETWNGSGWAYNHKEIRFWARIEPPCL
jgi:hypothetical protein